MEMVDILASVDCDQNYDYKTWKLRRRLLIMQIGERILPLSEPDINSNFENWENQIRVNQSIERVRSQLNVLMAYSILQYFREDIDQTKNTIYVVTNLFSVRAIDVVKASVQVLCWLASESPEYATIIKDPLGNAFEWIKGKKQKLVFAALYLIKRAKKYAMADTLHNIASNYDSFFQIVCSDEIMNRLLAVKLLVFQQKNLSSKSSSETVLGCFNNCFEFISQKASQPAQLLKHGPLLVLSELFKLQPNIFQTKLSSLCATLAEISTNAYDPISITALEFSLEIASSKLSIYTPKEIKSIILSIIGKCNKSQSTDDFFKILDKAVRTFKDDTPKKIIYDFISSLLKNPSNKRNCSNGFLLLSSMLETFTDARLDQSIFLNAPICDNYIRCLTPHVVLRHDVKTYISSVLSRGLSPKAPNPSITLSLKLAQTFQLQLFDNYMKMHESLIPIIENTQEDIRCDLMDTIKLESLKEADEFLLNAAVYDPSKKVRLSALSSLKPTVELSLSQSLMFMLHDPSFKVRRKALNLIADLMKDNPFDYTFPITEYISFIITTVRSTSDLKQAAKFASLLPIVAQKFSKIAETFIPTIIVTCLKLLKIENQAPQYATNLTDSTDKVAPTNEVVLRDAFNDPTSLMIDIDERKKTEAKRCRIFMILNGPFIDERDMHLLHTLANLGNDVNPYLNQALNAFYNIFTTRKSTKLLASAVESLTYLAKKIGTGLNLRLHHQYFIPVLMKMLICSHGDEVSVAILKLFGTACDSVNTTEIEVATSELSIDLRNPSFFTDFTISHLTPYFSSPTMQLYEAVTRIYDSAPKDAAKFVDRVIPMFIKGIETGTDKQKNLLFNNIEVITRQCPIESSQFLSQLTTIQLKYLSICNCIRLCASLSYHLMSGYNTEASKIFLSATKMMNITSRNYIKFLLKFLSFAVLYQDQPFEMFIDAIENRLNQTITIVFIRKLSRTLISLVQTKDLTMYQSRLSFITFKIIQLGHRQYILPLIPSLVICTGLPISVVRSWEKILGFSMPNIDELQEVVNSDYMPVLSSLNFVKKCTPKFKVVHTSMPSTQTQYKTFFSLEFNANDSNVNINKWLDDLCQKVISQSPSPVIRSCSTLANTINSFRQKLFPIAFLSCWIEARHEEKIHFSNIVKQILTINRNYNSFFVNIIEILDRAFMPLMINDEEIVKYCDSRPINLFFLQRMFHKNPSDKAIIEKLLDLNTTMGRHSAAHGMLVHAKGRLDGSTFAQWSEKLGEWDKALNLYGDSNIDISSRIRCYSHLEMWDKIKAMEQDFEKWNCSLREENAKHFAWAYYHSGDFQKVDYYVSQFHQEQHLSEVLFQAFYFLRTSKYANCQETINKAFNLLAKDTSIYIGGDAIRLHKNLHYSHMFVEMQEALEVLQTGQLPEEIATDIWNKRLKGFKRDSESWIQLIGLRSLVFAPQEYINVYLKMISVLRKERRWNLIDTYFNRFFSQSIAPNVDVTQSKILWARGRKEEAIELMRSAMNLVQMDEEETFMTSLKNFRLSKVFILIVTLSKQPIFKAELVDVAKQVLETDENDFLEIVKGKTPEEQKEFLIQLAEHSQGKLYQAARQMFSSYRIDSYFESKVYRILATYMHMKVHHDPENLKEVVQLFERAKLKNSADYRVWLGWAYANSRLIDITKNSDVYSNNAVTGFLRATQLRESNTLEYLCQMFSIFFRMTDTTLIKTTLVSDLLALPPSIINQIIPQITVQIAHSDSQIRQVVNKILHNFGKEHFQALYCPLRLYQSCEDAAKAATAHEILASIGKKQTEITSDYELFVEGMLRAAISWFEQWIVSLDSASRAHHDGNIERMDKILRNQFKQYKKPKCDLDKLFIRLNDQVIQQCKNLFKQHTNASIKKMWDLFKELFSQLTGRVKKLELILLPKVSESLATKRGFKIAIPGTYSVEHPVPLLDSIEPYLQVLVTQQHPRCVMMINSEGQKVKFLLKGNEDIRLDQRVMQFFNLINLLMNHSRTTREMGAQIVKYAIIPLAPNAGLISWVTGADTLHQMISDHRALLKQIQSIELDLVADLVGAAYNQMMPIQKLDVFEYITSHCEGNEIREVLWSRAPNATTWMAMNQNFTVTTALMSMVGYVIGLGDRHPSNIMVQRETGRVIHIDFGDSFEVAMNRTSFPEKVPFRLTRMIINALDCATVEGIFRKTCEDVMWVLRDSRSSLVAQLEIFIHEPLDEGEEKPRSQTQIIDRVGDKLLGKDKLLSSYNEGQKDMEVDEQVDALIKEASDPYNYTAHYAGWCPFW